MNQKLILEKSISEKKLSLINMQKIIWRLLNYTYRSLN